MKFENIDLAEIFLLNNNYYRLNVYFHKLMDKPDCFRKGTRFDNIIEIYHNDQWLRNKLLILLEPIEIQIRTRISYELGMKYGADCFYQNSNYKNSSVHKDIQKAFLIEINRNKKDPVIIHHNQSYQGRFPIWVIVEFLSFNAISKFFGNLDEKDKKRIASLSFGINEYFLGQWLHSLSVLRNICAHYGYLYQREYSVRPKLFKEFNWDTEKNTDLFALCLVLKKLSEEIKWKEFTNFICEREKNISSFQVKDYGFPENWEEFLD